MRQHTRTNRHRALPSEIQHGSFRKRPSPQYPSVPFPTPPFAPRGRISPCPLCRRSGIPQRRHIGNHGGYAQRLSPPPRKVTHPRLFYIGTTRPVSFAGPCWSSRKPQGRCSVKYRQEGGYWGLATDKKSVKWASCSFPYQWRFFWQGFERQARRNTYVACRAGKAV